MSNAMSESEQMVAGFRSPVTVLNHLPACVNGLARNWPAMGRSRKLCAHPVQRLNHATRPLIGRRDVCGVSKFVLRAAVECLAMAGCVAAAAMATVFFWL